MNAKRWTVLVVSAIEATELSGGQTTLQPGTYLMQRLDLTHYELTLDKTHAQIHLADLLGHVKYGAVRIPSGWP